MYSTCLFCHSALGANESLERFPVGRRLAFDSTKGRLWAVCLQCRRWNLTPVEERWEAIEDCERLYRGTTVRVSTEQIGLARLRDGLELIRVGRPIYPEFAAWRYGSRFLDRRRRARPRMMAVDAARAYARANAEPSLFRSVQGVGLLFATVFLGWPVIAAAGAVGISTKVLRKLPDLPVVHVPVADRAPLVVRATDLSSAEFSRDVHERWALSIVHADGVAVLRGPAATRGLGPLLALANRDGGSEHQIAQAVAKLEWFRGPDRLLQFAAARGAGEQGILGLGYEQRLSLEMAVHEDTERRALEGELAELETAWRDAERVAGIADNLFLPEAITSWLRRHAPNAAGDARP
jgi:hypothetical protein